MNFKGEGGGATAGVAGLRSRGAAGAAHVLTSRKGNMYVGLHYFIPQTRFLPTLPMVMNKILFILTFLPNCISQLSSTIYYF